MSEPEKFSVVGIKIGTITANLASIASFVFYIAGRSRTLPARSGGEELTIILYLAVLAAISYGILWTVAERVFHWDYGGGSKGKFPAGWSAVVLSLCVTLPLAIVPYAFERFTGTLVLPPMHWRAMLIVVASAAVCHLAIYGTDVERPNGLREKVVPRQQHAPFLRAVTMEAIYGIFFFGFMVLPYRLFVNPSEPLVPLLIGRELLPFLAFFFGMTLFIGIRYPDSMDDPAWIQVRGIIGGLLTMFCLCGGMFLS